MGRTARFFSDVADEQSPRNDVTRGLAGRGRGLLDGDLVVDRGNSRRGNGVYPVGELPAITGYAGESSRSELRSSDYFLIYGRVRTGASG